MKIGYTFLFLILFTKIFAQTQEFAGIGCAFNVDDSHYFKITEIIENTPAQRSGLKVNDLILAIDGQSTYDMKSEDGRDLIRGEAYTYVKLKIRSGGNDKDVSILRQSIKVNNS